MATADTTASATTIADATTSAEANTTETLAAGATTSPAATIATSGTATAASAAAARPGPPLLPRGTTTLAALLVIAADAMLLAGLLAAWFVIKGGTPAWPPSGVAIDTYAATVYSITTAMSSFAAAWAVAASRRNDQRSAGVAVIVTVLLGLAQFNLLWYDLSQTGFGVADHAYGTLYFLLMGFVLVHVGVAVIAIFVAGARAVAGHFGPRGHDPMRAAGALWHFSTAAWWAVAIAVFVFSPHG